MAIPGKASHLGLWVRAASDWGRVVYVLRDLIGEHEQKTAAANDGAEQPWSEEELNEVKRKLKNLGYL